jgi:hypothetical protein
MWALRSLDDISQLSQFCLPSRLPLTFEIGHVGPYIGVEGIDHHLAIGWSSNFDSSVNETRRRRCTSPGIVISDVLCFWEEVRKDASVELLLSDHSPLEQSFSGVIEGSVEEGEESSSFGCEDLLLRVVDGTVDGHALVDCFDCSHDGVCVCQQEYTVFGGADRDVAEASDISTSEHDAHALRAAVAKPPVFHASSGGIQAANPASSGCPVRGAYPMTASKGPPGSDPLECGVIS